MKIWESSKDAVRRGEKLLEYSSHLRIAIARSTERCVVAIERDRGYGPFWTSVVA